jgi:hypothetical protein
LSLSEKGRADFSFYSFNNLPIEFLNGAKRKSPKRELRAYTKSSADNQKLNKVI